MMISFVLKMLILQYEEYSFTIHRDWSQCTCPEYIYLKKYSVCMSPLYKLYLPFILSFHCSQWVHTFVISTPGCPYQTYTTAAEALPNLSLKMSFFLCIRQSFWQICLGLKTQTIFNFSFTLRLVILCENCPEIKIQRKKEIVFVIITIHVFLMFSNIFKSPSTVTPPQMQYFFSMQIKEKGNWNFHKVNFMHVSLQNDTFLGSLLNHTCKVDHHNNFNMIIEVLYMTKFKLHWPDKLIKWGNACLVSLASEWVKVE